MSGPASSRLLIAGFGRSGQAVARAVLTTDLPGGASGSGSLGFLPSLGQLTITDGADTAALRARLDEFIQSAARLKPELEVQAFLGAEALPEEAGHFELGVISPGLAPHDPLTVSVQRHCDELISELEFAWRLAPAGQKWIAITGSNGKTTTTMLCAHLLREAGRSAASVGNIGEPVTDLLCAEGALPEILVVEASSFQLEYTTSFAPQATALLNVAPDHLDWHGSLENYAAAKQKIFAHQCAGDLALLWDADPFAERTGAVIAQTPVTRATVSLSEYAAPAAYVHAGMLWLHLDPACAPQALCRADELPLSGQHNVVNALFAAALVAHFGVAPEQIAAGLKTFAAPAHRLELIIEVEGVRYFDDSKATNPDSVRAALTAFGPGEVHLLVGGQGKGTSYDELARVALPYVRKVYTFGAEGPALEEDFLRIQAQLGTTTPIAGCTDLEEAVCCAATIARPGEVVLLSPACASFDEFYSYAQRGDAFRAHVSIWAQTVDEYPAPCPTRPLSPPGHAKDRAPNARRRLRWWR
ncbi:MAG: UDP-N-acetylmuramoyl-L-alanine--D-glutamate ligase [Coriobacteriia bacterium]|nr:UDP-N-acetylmuramoyl-L-alanine--D-glutamate ligase [Coriobacteriia bacterium]